LLVIDGVVMEFVYMGINPGGMCRPRFSSGVLSHYECRYVLLLLTYL